MISRIGQDAKHFNMKRTPHVLQFQLLLERAGNKLHEIIVSEEKVVAFLRFQSKADSFEWGAKNYPLAEVEHKEDQEKNNSILEVKATGLNGIPLRLFLCAPLRATTFDDLLASTKGESNSLESIQNNTK